MDEKDDTTPFPREPWQKLLAEDGDGPPETTDARIRAAAHRDLAPRGRRWWLPASLAASFVLAVFVVQLQFGTQRVPVMSESNRGDGGAINARLSERENADAARPPGQAPAAAGDRRAKSASTAESDVYGSPDAEIAADSAEAGPRIGGPERELQAANEMPGDLETTATPPPVEPAQPAAQAAEPVLAEASHETGHEELGHVVASARESRRADAPQDPSATTKTRSPYEKAPEAWYAYIEKLRAQGRTEEADRQLARLEKAYPGWVERYLRDHPKE